MAEDSEDTYQSQLTPDSDFVKESEDALREVVTASMKTLVRDIQYDRIKDRVKYLIDLKQAAHDRVITIQAELERAQAEEATLGEQVNKLAAGDLSILDRQRQARCRYCDTTFDEIRHDGFCPNCGRDKRGEVRIVGIGRLLREGI